MGLGYTFPDADWPSSRKRLRQIIQKLSSLSLGPESTPTFAGLTISGDLAVTGDITAATITVNNSGIHILDTGGDHDLIFASGEDLGQDTTLTITLNDADRAVTFAGDSTINAGTHLNHALTLDSKLLSWWRFDDISGATVTDYVGANNGTLVAAPSQADGVVGKAISLNGTTQWMTANGTSLNTNFGACAFSAWIKPNFTQADASNYRLFDKGNDIDTPVIRGVFVASLDDWRFQTTTNIGTVNCDTTGLTWTADTWHQILCTYDGSHMRIYWDAALVGGPTAQTGVIQNGTGDFILGQDKLEDFPFKGDFCDVRFWGRNVTATEALELFELGCIEALTSFDEAYFKKYLTARTAYFDSLAAGHAEILGDIKVSGDINIVGSITPTSGTLPIDNPLGTDLDITLDGSSDTPGTLNYQSDNTLLNWDKDLTVAGTVEGDTVTDGTASLTGGTLSELFAIEADVTLQMAIAGVAQLNLTDGKLAPTTDNDIDLGDSTHKFKDVWVDGTVNTDNLTVNVGAITHNAVARTYSGSKVLVDGTATGFMEIAISPGEMIGGHIMYCIHVEGGTDDLQCHSGTANFSAVNKAEAVTSDIEEAYLPAREVEVVTAGTLSDDWTITDGNGDPGKITINCNANTNLATPTLHLQYTVTAHTLNTMTLL